MMPNVECSEPYVPLGVRSSPAGCPNSSVKVIAETWQGVTCLDSVAGKRCFDPENSRLTGNQSEIRMIKNRNQRSSVWGNGGDESVIPHFKRPPPSRSRRCQEGDGFVSARWSLPPLTGWFSARGLFYEKGTGSFSFFRGSILLLRPFTLPIQTFLWFFQYYKTHVHDSVWAHSFNNPQLQRLFRTKNKKRPQSSAESPSVLMKLARAMYR